MEDITRFIEHLLKLALERKYYFDRATFFDTATQMSCNYDNVFNHTLKKINQKFPIEIRASADGILSDFTPLYRIDISVFESTIEDRLRESDRTAQACVAEIKRTFHMLDGWQFLYEHKNKGHKIERVLSILLIAIIERFTKCINDKFEDWGYGRPLGEAKRTNTNTQPPQPPTTLPIELTSGKALKGLKRLVELGYITSEYQWIEEGHTRYQQVKIAMVFHEELKYKYKWRPFVQLWGYNKFAQKKKDLDTHIDLGREITDELESIFD